MKNSTKNTCCACIVGLLAAILIATLVFLEFLPSVICNAYLVVKGSAIMLGILFILGALGNCHCLRKFNYVMCRYGTAFTIALVLTMLFGFLLMGAMGCCIYMIPICLAFLATWMFVFSVVMFAIILATMLDLGCPHCTTVTEPTPKPSCFDPPYSES